MTEMQTAAPGGADTLDFLTAEIVWHRLVSIVEECEAVIAHMSFSPVVGEARDYAAALLDARLEVIAQSPSAMGGFVTILGRASRRILELIPPDTLRPGDVLVTNDPWICAGHLPDVMTLTPVFAGDRIVAYATSIAHMSDLGGQISAAGRDVFEEGLRIWPCHLYRAGEPNEDVFRFVRSNSRSPQQVVGDLQAQVAATELMGRRVLETLGEHELDDLAALSDEIQGRAERAVRSLIAALPDGVYRGGLVVDGVEDDVHLAVALEIDGDRIHVDYGGTSPQVRAGINCPFTLTVAETVYVLLVALGGSDLPLVDGAVRPVTVSAPEGCILNASFPAPSMVRTAVVNNVAAVIFRALAPIVGEQIRSHAVSAHYGGCWSFVFRGLDSPAERHFRRGGPPQMGGGFVQLYLFNGGTGATGSGDGATATSMPVNCANVPVEVMEARAPFLFERKELLPDSGGAGRFRGGLGQHVLMRNLADLPLDFVPRACGAIANPPQGIDGGLPGSGGAMEIDGSAIDYRRPHTVLPGQVVRVAVPGGGGFGDPGARPRDALRRDLAEGAVSPEAAVAVYGVEPAEPA